MFEITDPFILACLLLLVLLLWLVSHQQQAKNIHAQQKKINLQTEEITAFKIQLASFTERLQNRETQQLALETTVHDKQQLLAELSTLNAQQKSQIAELTVALQKDRQSSEEKTAILEDAKLRMSHEFKLLANQIFEEKGKKFSEQNRMSMDDLLKPMREQVGEFRKRVDEVHLDDAKDRASLRQHLQQMEKLNRQMSVDAIGLTHALKGESKSQGNWGEMILERILERTGLREGREFRREQSFTAQDGSRLRPDVIIYMPGDKQVIIDSKVSLTDYERAVSASDDISRKSALSAHLRSLKNHIHSLAEKRYDHLPDIHSPDYVLMFMPIEGAYLMAIEADSTIFESAFEQRVAVVTPSTLYATLKLIEQLWRYERQSENTLKLIDRACKLHDKMVTFVDSFEEIGARLEQAQQAYNTSLNRIKSGPGNVINQIATLGKLAGKTKKELPKHLTEHAALANQQQLTPPSTANHTDLPFKNHDG
ncbi:MAG: DNA recombination protein RmuC [Mariprofundus sp.]|nr:DNA recombination protein RmuC [Mariprofundus sp.]